jgi:hypothetical protein
MVQASALLQRRAGNTGPESLQLADIFEKLFSEG